MQPIQSLLDVFLTNKPQSFCDFINTDTGISDFHNLTGVISKAYAPQSNRRMITYRSMKNFNQSNFSRDIDLIPFHVCEMFDDVNDVACAQQNLLSSVIDSYAPVKRICVRENQVSYMNGELRKAIHQRNMWRTKHFKNKRDTAARDKYVSCRNKVVKLMKSSVNKQRFLTPGHQGWNDLHSLCRIGMECYLLNNDDNNIIYWIMMIIMIMMMMIIIMIIMMTMMIIGTATIMIMIIIITTTLTMTIMKMIMIKTAQTPCQSLYKDRRI